MEKEELSEISEEKSKNFLKKIFGIVFLLVILAMLIIYWFLPSNPLEFTISSSGNSNFSLNSSYPAEMQFYENMRYSSSNISYRIEECPLNKKNDMERAIEILENRTILNFYSVEENEEIIISCSDEVKPSENLNFFIAGEGGPTEITKLEDFNLINSGKVLLLKESKCPEPNVGLHELLHALGFNHSSNINNIMYPISKCSQILGDDIPALINDLYSYPPYPDLKFENASAETSSRYLDLNLTIKNYGFVKSGKTKMIIYIDNKSIEEYPLDEIDAGSGKRILLQNLRINVLNVKEIELFIDSNFPELDKKNNKIKLEIKDY